MFAMTPDPAEVDIFLIIKFQVFFNFINMFTITTLFSLSSIFNFRIVLLLGCNNGDGVLNSGTNLAKGTCPDANDVCYDTGSCGGRYFSQNQI